MLTHEQLQRAVELLQDLVAIAPATAPSGASIGVCHYCGAEVRNIHSLLIQHEDKCPWWLAWQFVAGLPSEWDERRGTGRGGPGGTAILQRDERRPTMRATGRRIGRIIGVLDDLRAQLHEYKNQEVNCDADAHKQLDDLGTAVFLACRRAEDLADYLNRRDAPPR